MNHISILCTFTPETATYWMENGEEAWRKILDQISSYRTKENRLTVGRGVDKVTLSSRDHRTTLRNHMLSVISLLTGVEPMYVSILGEIRFRDALLGSPVEFYGGSISQNSDLWEEDFRAKVEMDRAMKDAVPRTYVVDWSQDVEPQDPVVLGTTRPRRMQPIAIKTDQFEAFVSEVLDESSGKIKGVKVKPRTKRVPGKTKKKPIARKAKTRSASRDARSPR